MKKFGLSITFLIIILYSTSHSQYTINHHYLGPCIGFSWYGSAAQFGVNYEYGLDKNFTVGGIMRYYSWSESFGTGKYSYSYLFFGAQGNYHIKLDDPKLDPFFGLVLGFNAISSTWERKYYDYSYNQPAASATSGLFLGAHGTFRYWLQPNLGLIARLNFGNLGYSGLDLGVDFKF